MEDTNEGKTTRTLSLGIQVVTQMSRNNIPPKLKRYGENAVTPLLQKLLLLPLIVNQTRPVINNCHDQNNNSKSYNKRKHQEDEYYPSKHSSNVTGQIRRQSYVFGNECSSDTLNSQPAVLQIGLANAIPCEYENQKSISVTLSNGHSSGNVQDTLQNNVKTTLQTNVQASVHNNVKTTLHNNAKTAILYK